MTEHTQKTDTLRSLPVIPLSGTVAFPNISERIDSIAGSAAYAFADALTDGSDVLLLAQKDMTKDEPGLKDFFAFGVVAKTKKVVQNPDLSRSVIFEGVCRAKVLDITAQDGFFRALIHEHHESLVQPTENDLDCLFAVRDLLHGAEEYDYDKAHRAYLAAVACDDVGKTADFIASLVFINYKDKQEILEATDPVRRLNILRELLGRELDLIACENRIETTVRESIEDSHREFYLREQMKAIQNELGGEEEDDDEIREYNEKIAAAHLPDYVETKLKKELSRLAKTPYGAAESTVLRTYLDTCLDIPFSNKSEEKVSVRDARTVLEEDHDGLEKIKERILEYIAVREIAPNVRGQILCLVGPPGVGKTSIAISVARAMKRKYARISLGGVRDEADIRGHRKTYVGAMPGRIVEALTDAGIMNPVIILDEVDKLSSGVTGDPASALLEVLDPEQNRAFRDHYTEIPIDLSDCVFIATANYYEGIPAALVDRMEIIELSSYTEREKFEIARHHLIPKQRKNNGLTDLQFRVTDAALREVIRHYTKEAGVRSLERTIASLARKVALKIAEGESSSVSVGTAQLKEMLGAEKYLDERPEKTDPVGVVNGLAYTSVGGDLLKVEVLVMEGTGKTELTGSLGDVMKESAKIAVSYVRSIASSVGIKEDFYKTKDLHIHFPEGAVPKDGPSAGVTMTTAIVSALTGIPVRRDIAMTGEVTLRGRVLPIGGLKEKTVAAYIAGIRTVLIPKDNMKDLEEIDKEAREHLTFIPCETVDDVLKNALTDIPKKNAAQRRPIAPTAAPVGATV